MGQDIKYLITTEEIKIPIHIIHFKERNSTIFPILMEDSDYQRMCEYPHDLKNSESDDVASFFDLILGGGFNLEYPTKRLLEFIALSGLKSLAVIGYREICDLPQNIGNPFLFIDDKIYDLTKINFDSERQIFENEIHKILNSEILFTDIINNEKQYWCYENSETYYLEGLKNCH